MKSLQSLVEACKTACTREATADVKSSLAVWLVQLEEIQVCQRMRCTWSCGRV